MQLQDMFSQISARHKSAEQVSSWHETEQHCSVFLRHVSWQGIRQRQDSNDRHTWLRCKGHIADSVNLVFPCEHTNTATEKIGETRFDAAIAASPKILPMIMLWESSIRYSIPMDTEAVSSRE